MPTPESLTKTQWRHIAIAGYGPTLASSIGFGAVIPLIPLSARHMGASLGTAAFIASLLAMGTLLGDIPAGAIISRIGEKRSLAGACIVNAVVLSLITLVNNLSVLAIAVLTIGLVGSVFNIARQSFLTEAVPLRYRGRALSTLGGVFRFGNCIGPLAGAAVIARYGLSHAYGFAAIMTLIAAGVTLFLPDVPREAPVGSLQPRLIDVISSHKKSLLTLGFGVMSIQIVRQARQAVLPLWCESHQLAPETTSLIFSASMACDVLLFLPGGWLMDRVGRWWLCVPSMLVMATGLLLLPLTNSGASIAAIAMLLGLGNGISSGIVMTLASDSSPAVSRTQYLSVFRLFGDTGQMFAPLLVSLITGFAPLAVAAAALGGIGYAGAAWLTKWVPRERISR
ncbi:MAG: MFS transporter [Propionibacteriaceae bacterium]